MQQLNLFSHKFIAADGYGRFSFQLIRALVNAGMGVHPYLIEMLNTPGWFQRLAGINTGWLNIALAPAHEIVSLPGRQWAFTMFEASVIPYEFAECLNASCERLIVPCQQNVEAFKRGGINIPIDIVPGGVEFSEFPLLPNVPKNRPYTFLCLGDRGERKGMIETLTAFYSEFKGDEDVRFVIKARPHMLPGINNGSHNDKRVSFWLEEADSMTPVFEQADCFVFASYAEGYGMPAREAAAMGLPVIASRHSGLADNLDCWALPLEKFTERPARSLNTLTLPPDSMWWVPDVDEIRAQMRWCYEHQDEARAKGQSAAVWLRENQTWDHAATKLIKLIERWA